MKAPNKPSHPCRVRSLLRLLPSSRGPTAAFPGANAFCRSVSVSLVRVRMRCVASIVALMALPYGAFAQDQKQPAEKPPAKKSKASADSCDGALDIVPGKPSTFTRKRRPSKSETKPEANSNTKSETKPDARP